MPISLRQWSAMGALFQLFSSFGSRRLCSCPGSFLGGLLYGTSLVLVASLEDCVRRRSCAGGVFSLPQGLAGMIFWWVFFRRSLVFSSGGPVLHFFFQRWTGLVAGNGDLYVQVPLVKVVIVKIVIWDEPSLGSQALDWFSHARVWFCSADATVWLVALLALTSWRRWCIATRCFTVARHVWLWIVSISRRTDWLVGSWADRCWYMGKWIHVGGNLAHGFDQN